MTGAQNINVHIEPTVDPLLGIEMTTTFSGLYYQASMIPAASFPSLYNSGNLVELRYYFYDADNPTIKSASGTIRLRAASN